MLEELAVIARELGQVDAEDGPMSLLASLVAACRPSAVVGQNELIA
jgi:hypothetical protein